jgi:hypothetical protein
MFTGNTGWHEADEGSRQEKDARPTLIAPTWGLNRIHFNEGGTIMSDRMTAAEFLAIYDALDEGRKQELVDHALELIEEQRDERRTEQRV